MPEESLCTACGYWRTRHPSGHCADCRRTIAQAKGEAYRKAGKVVSDMLAVSPTVMHALGAAARQIQCMAEQQEEVYRGDPR